MREVMIITAGPQIMEYVEPTMVGFSASHYQERMNLLRGRMSAHNLSHVIVYADREHFANMDFLIGFEPRFEQALLVVPVDGLPTLVLGNEGWAHSFISPLELSRVLYQNFSLQGQPRERLVPLTQIFSDCGIDRQSSIGVIGFKYFEDVHIERASYRFDIPAYIMEELYEVAEASRVANVTKIMTDPTAGLRVILRTATDIAHFEYMATKTSRFIINMLKSLKTGRTELEVSRLAELDATPTAVFPMVNFSVEHVKTGLRSPSQHPLKEGDAMTVAYGTRGSLVARSGIAVKDEADLPAEQADAIEGFYKPYFAALVEWYEALRVGVKCREMYAGVMERLGDQEKFGIYLNPGHNISTDEWPNTPFFKDSPYELPSGAYLQCDVIASSQQPFRQAIMEDGVILADGALREQLHKEYPEVYGRIMQRKEFMRNVIGINLHEDVLPVSNCQAIYHPFMLDTTRIFSVK